MSRVTLPKGTRGASGVAEKAEHVDKGVMTKSLPSTLLLDLPLELRECILTYALADMCSGPQHPYDRYNTHRFKTYRSLRLTNRQLSAETQRVFSRDIFPNGVMFCFTDVQRFEAANVRLRHPVPDIYAAASFTLAYVHESRPHINRSSMRNLLWGQPGSAKWHKITDDLNKNASEVWDILHEWKPSDATRYGADVLSKNYEDCGCRTTDWHDNMSYHELTYPALDKSLRLKTFAWLGNDGMRQGARTVLTGKMKDVKWYSGPMSR